MAPFKWYNILANDNFIMEKQCKNKLIKIAHAKMLKNDSSHDICHATRVLQIATKIATIEKADIDIIVPSAIFHDVIVYPKNHPKRLNSAKESSEFAREILENMKSFPQEKIDKTCESINLCSFTKAQIPNFIEAKILQDADSLEAVGAISIMRTFSSAGAMNRSFYNPKDPFCKKRKPNDGLYALDLFFTRLLVVQDRLHTKTAKEIAKRRIVFVKHFLKELGLELRENVSK